MKFFAILILLLALLSCAAAAPPGDAQEPAVAVYLPLVAQAGPTTPRAPFDNPPALRAPDEVYLPLIHH